MTSTAATLVAGAADFKVIHAVLRLVVVAYDLNVVECGLNTPPLHLFLGASTHIGIIAVPAMVVSGVAEVVVDHAW